MMQREMFFGRRNKSMLLCNLHTCGRIAVIEWKLLLSSSKSKIHCNRIIWMNTYNCIDVGVSFNVKGIT